MKIISRQIIDKFCSHFLSFFLHRTKGRTRKPICTSSTYERNPSVIKISISRSEFRIYVYILVYTYMYIAVRYPDKFRDI